MHYSIDFAILQNWKDFKKCCYNVPLTTKYLMEHLLTIANKHARKKFYFTHNFIHLLMIQNRYTPLRTYAHTNTRNDRRTLSINMFFFSLSVSICSKTWKIIKNCKSKVFWLQYIFSIRKKNAKMLKYYAIIQAFTG